MDPNYESNVPGMSFSHKRARVLIFYSTVKALGNPEYIRILLNSKEKKVAVQSCTAIDKDSFRVPAKIGGDYSFEIASLRFLSVIDKICGWDNNKTFNVRGIAIRSQRLAEFRLDEAKEISQNQFVDPENCMGPTCSEKY